jgi:LPS sulfotransferase NodH
VLKSPPHTARIRLLLEMFPEARFVHIHRDPYVVFQSFQHYYDTACWYTYMQRPDLAGIDDLILRRYTAMYDAYFAEKDLIPAGRLHEIPFAALEADPMGEIAALYERLALPGFDRFSPKLRQYVESLRGYQKNRYHGLPPETQEKVHRAWRRSFEAWGYPAS